jgi:SAM-dependent methyltransferase
MNTMRRMRFLLRGQSLARILMNEALAHETLRGSVVDVGGGHHPDYFDFLRRAGEVQVRVLDASLSGIDFEKDPFPFGEASADTILLCNVLEHIYDYRFLLRQVRRILKEGGQLIGFVPFWVGYHPDPHDYFRYTGEALQRILAEADFKDTRIRTIGGGPVLANFNTLVLSLPRILRPLAYLPYAVLDALFLTLSPKSRGRNPLGFLFTATP